MTGSRSAITYLRSLGSKKHRKVQGTFIVEGVRSLDEAVSSTFEILEVYHTREILRHPGGETLVQKLRNRAVSVREIAPRELEKIADTVTSQGVVAILKQQTVDAAQLIEGAGTDAVFVAADAVTDPGNLGSIVRTCDWFGVQGVLVGRGSVDLYNPKVVRGTMGGIFHLPVAVETDLPAAVSRARDSGYRIYVTDVAGETHFDRVSFDRRSIIVVGNETRGVSDQLKSMADVRLTIRKYGAAESLNVGVACGIVLSALHRLTAE